MKNEKKQEFTLKITRANKSQLVVILYDMVLEYLQDALVCHEKNNEKEYRKNILNARSCIDELIHSINHRHEVAGVLQGLYYFYKREITTASVLRKPELLTPVMNMIRELKKSAEVQSENDKSEAIMENTQHVYAGLTYGKNSLNIDLSDQGKGRGFLV